MVELKEGLRVMNTRLLKYICVSPYNRVNDKDFGGDADYIYPGTEGTVFRFITIEMQPHYGGAHHEMWGVVYDGVPAPAAGGYGVCDGKDLALAPKQQNDFLVQLREYWQAKLAERKEHEALMAKAYKTYGPWKWGPNRKELFATLEWMEWLCKTAQKDYDQAAGIPESRTL